MGNNIMSQEGHWKYKWQISMFPELQHKTPFRNRILIIWMVVRLVLISAWFWSYFIFFTSTFKNSLTIQIYNKQNSFQNWKFTICVVYNSQNNKPKIKDCRGGKFVTKFFEGSLCWFLYVLEDISLDLAIIGFFI